MVSRPQVDAFGMAEVVSEPRHPNTINRAPSSWLSTPVPLGRVRIGLLLFERRPRRRG